MGTILIASTPFARAPRDETLTPRYRLVPPATLELGPSRNIIHLGRRLDGGLAAAVDAPGGIVQWQLMTAAEPAKVQVGSIRDDPVEPRTERRIAPERVDLAHHRPKCLLHDTLGILRIPRDAASQATRAALVLGDERFGGTLISAPEGSD